MFSLSFVSFTIFRIIGPSLGSNEVCRESRSACSCISAGWVAGWATCWVCLLFNELGCDFVNMGRMNGFGGTQRMGSRSGDPYASLLTSSSQGSPAVREASHNVIR